MKYCPKHEQESRHFRMRLMQVSIIALYIVVIAVVGFIIMTTKTQSADRTIATSLAARMPSVQTEYPILDEGQQVEEETPGVDAVDAMEIKKIEPVVTSRLGVIVDDYETDVDYSLKLDEVYEEAKLAENPEHVLAIAEIYEAQRNLKIKDTDMDLDTTDIFVKDNTLEDIKAIKEPHHSYIPYEEWELNSLAALVYGEAGSSFMSDFHQQCVASVVVNRVLSDRFAETTIYDVMHAPLQYPNTCDLTYFDERTLENVRQVLEYGPVTEGVFQSTQPQGSCTLQTFQYPESRSTITYICT